MEQSTQDRKELSLAVRIVHAIAVAAFIVALGYFISLAVSGESTYSFKRGLDIAGGTQLVYVADTSSLGENDDVKGLMDTLRDVIERRVNLFGVAEPVVYTETGSVVSDTPKHRLVVELPGVTDVNEAIKQIGSTPHLEFKLVNTSPAAVSAQKKYAEGKFTELKPEEVDALATMYIVTGLTGKYVSRAQVSFNQGTGGFAEPVVSLTFNSEGAALFADITKNHIGEQLAIFLDGTPISSPRINEAIYGGTAVVSGGFSLEEAKQLADNLSFGSLPIPISLSSTQIIDASLGTRVLDDGVRAGLFGLAFVALLMIIWYRITGLVSVLGLVSYVILLLSLVLVIPITLTAAGIAGLILSLGMAIDANVLIFERFKEEYRSEDVQSSLRIAFSRAWPAIRDGNATTFFAAIVLYWFGTSFVQGFAFMLGLGIATSLVSALFVTRIFARLLPNVTVRDKTIIAKLINTGAVLK